MILRLSVRFQKHIAFLLLGIFYSQLIIAAHTPFLSSSPFPSSSSFLSSPYGVGSPVPLDALPGTATDPGTDSGTDPGRKAKKTPALGAKRPHTLKQLPKSLLPIQLMEARKQPFTGGPSQPEMKGFTSVNANNMVDLFTGDFAYNIPLLDVGGYPINISYHSGRTPDEDASWVGLGWNINPGSITRDMRGVPDDFNGGADTIRKVEHIVPNTSWGLTVGGSTELFGLPLPVDLSLGIFHTTYNGWGLEAGVNPSLSVGEKGFGYLTGKLNISDNSQNGLTLNPGLDYNLKIKDVQDKGNGSLGLSLSAAYNSRTGLRDIQLGMNAAVSNYATDDHVARSSGAIDFAGLNFAWSAYTPTMTMPMTNYNVTATLKTGLAIFGSHPNVYFEGYYGQQRIDNGDTSMSLPAYGYLNFQSLGNNWSALTDFNREKEVAYRESPPVPHIAVPGYTYDVFTISGEGTGGMFRPYRGDIGFIADHLISSKSLSGAASIDVGASEIAHGGVDLNANYSTTQNGPWLQENTLKSAIAFKNSNGLFEAAYFRNPGEKTINDARFYNAIGGDDVVTPSLYQPGNSGPSIVATNYLTRSSLQKVTGTIAMTSDSAVRTKRDKRSEVISYLTAQEASVSGLDKYIYHYGVNQFGLRYCENDSTSQTMGGGRGLLGYYFQGMDLAGTPKHLRLDSTVFFNWSKANPFFINMPLPTNGMHDMSDQSFGGTNYSVRWLGSLKAPASGRYIFGLLSDDGTRLWMNDSLIINRWGAQAFTWKMDTVYLVAGQMYNIRLEYYQAGGGSNCLLAWQPPGSNVTINVANKCWIPSSCLYPPGADTAVINPIMTQEDRVNNFRKANHLSEIDVLNPDGRRYVYGIPVYNLQQKDVSFSINPGRADLQHGLTWYNDSLTPIDNSTQNSNGQDGYYSREEIPAYAHSFLLTGILSPDYQDVTGDGISDDDIGDAVRFNYSKTSGVANPYGWRAPYIHDSANYNEGFRSYTLDDKAHYIYGTKELWYLNSIESKTMIATFTLQHRSDLRGIDERGNKTDTSKAMCLKEINLYSKADFLAHGIYATPIKTVHFVYDYELCRGINRPVNDQGKLTLKEIWFSYNGNDKGILNPYVFNYNQNNPRYNTNMVDKWGSYKDPAQNPGATVNSPINNAEYPYALQDSSAAAYNAGAWMLDSIQLPSGGDIKVNYESDDYAYVQNRRATRMCNLLGLGGDSSGSYTSHLYNLGGADNLYAYVQVPYGVSTKADVRSRYLNGIQKLYFRLYVPMPATDDFGRGSEYIPCYADTAAGSWYGPTKDPNIIWIKLNGVNKSADGNGTLSPLAQTAINFLRLNLPSKAYPGSQVSDNITLLDGIAIILSMVGNIVDLLNGFSNTARLLNWVNQIDPVRSFVRLDCPTLKKYGGGLRVKSILIYDRWDGMTAKKEKQTVYGQTYDYTTSALVNGDSVRISSGVASWEPNVGGEENPFHLPIEYVEKASIIGPAAAAYTEEPLGESFYPGAAIGYSKVRVRSIHTTGTRSANGYSETQFYTSYDFPTSWDWSVLDNSTKKRYKPLLNNFLRVNSMNYLTLAQGFKVELNDMNGKMRSEATYAETDSLNPISYTENFYRVDNQNVQSKHLNNTVMTIDPLGNIDPASVIGRDAELMGDMREQTSSAIGGNLNVNVDLFTVGLWPMIVPSLLNLFQHETTRFRSAAMTKIINRYGILDSIVHMDKGSLVSSKNLLYDAETGEPILVRTQNEFNDPVYDFSYPAHWAYKGMGPAYQNIDAVLNHLVVRNGQINEVLSGLSSPASTYLTAGDELLVASKQSIVTPSRADTATFAQNYLLTVLDTNARHGGLPALFLVDQYGSPFSGIDVDLKVIRSGHRNMGSAIGSLASLANPLVQDNTGVYHLQLDSNTRVVSASAARMQQAWQVEDKHRSNILTACVENTQDSAIVSQQSCACLQPLFDYLISNRRLVQPKAAHLTVGDMIQSAAAAGVHIDTSACPLLAASYYKPYYTLTAETTAYAFEVVIGTTIIDLRTTSGYTVPLYSLTSSHCDPSGTVWFKNPSLSMPPPDTVVARITPSFSVNLFSSLGGCPFYQDTLLGVDSLSADLYVENNLLVDNAQRNSLAIIQFNQLLRTIPKGANIVSAKLILQADTNGHMPSVYDSSNSVNPADSLGISLTAPPGWFPGFPYDTLLYQAYRSPWYTGVANKTPFQNDTIDVTSYLSDYIGSQGLGNYTSDNFILTQGSGGLQAAPGADTSGFQPVGVPPYLLSGYSNYYSTFYSQRYPDPAKWPAISVVYTMSAPFTDTAGAYLSYNSSLACTTVYGRSCFSSVTDTLVNPFHYGIIGNYRPLENIVYYAGRQEPDPTQPTNIRTNGAISGFMPYWTLQSGLWQPSIDSTRWVWNSQTTMYNRKGFELENKDPLGRYNSGLYGYGETLPTAVTQNSRYQEMAFEGFEDYGFVSNTCDTVCSEARPFDFSPYLSYISDSTAHTGLSSLRLSRAGSIIMSAPVQAAPPVTGVQLTDSTSIATGFDGIKAKGTSVLPPFEPIAGQKMEFGTWVREINSCACQQYSKGHVVVIVRQSSGDSTVYNLSPSGNMIEGWQRYDSSFLLPLNATQVELVLVASDTSTTYFDDIRIHPFNADMKSYVYNPINLRLMAELDENNYATFYEYDDDGTLVRVKKETERGILTIKETRSALLKNN
jgi:hypothetical protein